MRGAPDTVLALRGQRCREDEPQPIPTRTPARPPAQEGPGLPRALRLRVVSELRFLYPRRCPRESQRLGLLSYTGPCSSYTRRGRDGPTQGGSVRFTFQIGRPTCLSVSVSLCVCLFVSLCLSVSVSPSLSLSLCLCLSLSVSLYMPNKPVKSVKVACGCGLCFAPLLG